MSLLDTPKLGFGLMRLPAMPGEPDRIDIEQIQFDRIRKVDAELLGIVQIDFDFRRIVRQNLLGLANGFLKIL